MLHRIDEKIIKKNLASSELKEPLFIPESFVFENY